VSTVLLQDKIFGGLQPLPDELVETLKCRWVALYGLPTKIGLHQSSHYGTNQVFWLIPPFQRASFLAARVIHSSDWLLALPISA